jgi:WASH complex subunit strumpellin
MVDLDDELRDNFVTVIDRFYMLFVGLVRYHGDLYKFFEDLLAGAYIQDTAQGLLMDVDGKQLMVEALALWGALMLLLDERFDPMVRERLGIAHMRFRGDLEVMDWEDVVRLLRATGYNRADPTKRPKGYPEDYFARFPIQDNIVRMVLGRLRLDDVYNTVR